MSIDQSLTYIITIYHTRFPMSGERQRRQQQQKLFHLFIYQSRAKRRTTINQPIRRKKCIGDKEIG
ncbi:hypothetical protein BLOT_013982 [Blomia tropicalis]|nr:hypothetical protein BLOT_013982 [Blomia tropicalis]